MDVSVIICTRNRAQHLRRTLSSIAETSVPSGWAVELLVVDNGSTDETETVVASWGGRWPTRRVVAPEPGLSRARNVAVEAAIGDVLLFTDDDVRVPTTWIAPMVTPIRNGHVDALGGGSRLTDPLRRPWMTPYHLSFLADTEYLRDSGARQLTGANMAIRRDVFESGLRFNPSLGAGPDSTGFHEETLLGYQLLRAGGRLDMALDVCVEHVPDPDRILHSSFRDASAKMGRSDAYLDYHWHHLDGSRLRSMAAILFWTVRLGGDRLLHRPPVSGEGGRLCELRLRRRQAYHRAMGALTGTPRHYEKHGLVRRTSGTPPATSPTRPLRRTSTHDEAEPSAWSSGRTSSRPRRSAVER